MVAANVGPLERSCVCFVDAGLEAFGCEDRVRLVVNLPIRITFSYSRNLHHSLHDKHHY